MSRDPNQLPSSSSVITASLSATAPRIQSSGLPSFVNANAAANANAEPRHSPSGDRLRLPPLSSLIPASSSQPSRSSTSPVLSPHAAFYPHQDWSPSKSNTSTSFDSQSLHPPSGRDTLKASKSDKYLSTQRGPPSSYDVGPSRYHGAPPPLRRSNSSNSTTTTTTTSILNLPPLNALHIRHSSQSPLEAPSQSITDRDRLQPPKLPTQSSSSARHRLGPASSSFPESGVGPIRRRYTGESTGTTPYSRPSPPSDAEYFNHIWEIYSYACRVNDDAAGSMRHTYPAIGHSDVKMLLYHFNRELERLDQYNPRLSNQLAQDAGLSSASSNRSSRHSPLSSPSTSTSSQLQSQSWMNVPRRTGGMDRLSPHRDASYHHSDYAIHRRGSHGESHSSGASGAAYTTPGQQPYRSLQASPRSMHHQTHPYQHHPYSYQQHQYGSYPNEGPPPFSSNMAYNPNSSSSMPPKRVRKRKDEAEQSCLSCSATETPEWRKGPTGPRTLCNACGLLFAKQCRKKELDAQARGERPKGSRPMAVEVMSTEEKEQSLAELRIAVNARAANGSPPI